VKRSLPAVMLAVALAAIAAGWTSHHGAARRVWIASPYVKLQAATSPARWKPVLVAPRGGRASFQLVVDGDSAVRPVPGGLHGPGGAKLRSGAVSVLRELTVPVTARSSAVARGLMGDVPDPLVPLSVRPPLDTSRQVFWVSVEVPRTQRAGVYQGSVRVGSRSAPYGLRVADVTLPQRRALHTWFLVWSTHADDAEHHPYAAPAYTHVLTRYGVGDGTAAGGDAAVGIRPDSIPEDASDAVLQRIARGVGADAARLKARVPDAVPYSYVIDEPSGDQLGQVHRWGDALAHEAPGVRQLVTATTDPSLGSSVGAWAMHLGALTPAVLAATHALGAEAWVYSSCCETPGDPTLLLDQDAVGNLAVAPAAWQQGAAGLFYWSVNDYTGDPYTDARNHIDEPARVGNGDGVLLYPGRPLGLRAPNPSLRLALVAAGLQIADEAALLARRGHADQARALLARVLPDTARFVDSPAAWQVVERALLRGLEHA
jgi:glycosyl hydrolase family 123